MTGAGISCTISNGVASGDCTEIYANGTAVPLSQVPTSGHSFAGWGGACSGTGACSVTMNQPRTVSAGFTPPLPATLTITAGSGTGSGTVTGAGISCTISNGVASGDCTEIYANGTVVTLTSTPTSGHSFAGWGGACSGTGACTVTMSQAQTVTANFASISTVVAHLADLLLGQGLLSPDERALVDRLGNRNNEVDLGDLLAIIDRNPGLAFSPELVRKLDSLGVKVERTRDTTTPRMERR